VAGNFFSQINISELAPPIYNKTVSEKKYYDHLIKSNETKINYLETEIDQKRSKLNKYNSVDVNNFNNLVDKYNSLLATQESYVDIYNSKVDKLNNLNIISRCISSIGGGINLSPTEFKIISENTNSPKLQEVISMKNKIQTVGKTSQYGNWVRSISGRGGSRINKIPVNSWKYSKSMNENIEYNYNSDSGDFTSVFINPNLENWQNKISVNGFTDYVKYSKNTNILQIVHSGFLNKCRANISSNGKRFVFYQ
ncbi:MAG: hypothetical protein KAT74_03985, partial [Candidatus Cloacimonetes bacterium]|nr:hypothetical protein [Candidatus Cloacimonadota bacterium]